MDTRAQENKEDVVQVSEAMDRIAKLILAKRVSERSPSQPPVKLDYESKLDHLSNLIDSLLSSSQLRDIPLQVDREKLDSTFSGKVEIIEKQGQKYALIPVKDGLTTQKGETKNKKKKKKKKNNIQCSYCHETGHTRANCQLRLSKPL
ncbi:uncharacterized protein KNAG_0D02030 [Huiozyma naganishii CBS 8797]|uniref:CCHC-type domain-containing protein n=1 Tax=Huiozyma naganishii (strain ATCC MYA-139 / BCRC 22969 / CBS 8797 / KCTC 17520 / NBRC 10181 / NCYC 3082 / Yp74L-3) TaxID=1071383 RepID=J7S5P9_HUIN7|nr:hypothetical protein KNAG_0D02030 [Kazachstania naganishii CBS 8797]CCK69954.1 hypothetical protein KNAG_0D02030 [Kazachstania naganishii CBS 8797]